MKRNLVVVCGNRNAKPRDWQGAVEYVLGQSYEEYGGTLVVVEGGANGIDTIVRNTCEDFALDYLTVRALWARRGKSAGPLRNLLMGDLGPVFVWALHDDIVHSKGTFSMVKVAVKKKLPFQVVNSRCRTVILPPELDV